jgi:hypothetical protein
MTADCELLLFCLQCEFRRQDTLWVLQCGDETVSLLEIADVLPLHRRDVSETIPICAQEQSQRLSLSSTSVVKSGTVEAIAVLPRQFTTPSPERFQTRQEFRKNQQLQSSSKDFPNIFRLTRPTECCSPLFRRPNTSVS